MAAEIALIDILRDDATLGALLGGIGTSARVYPLERPQGSGLPAILARGQDIEPSDTKDGVSTLDTEFIQVLMYDEDLNQLILTIEARVRTLLDRIAPGIYNGVTVQSSQFIDRDTFLEQIDNNSFYAVEHIYKVRVKR
jgi:hypothetical protein